MQIFIDESGSFAGFHDGSISVVGALAIPDGKLRFIEKKYASLRKRLPQHRGEVKGRLLNERQVDEVVALLAKNEVLFEITAVDLGIHSEAAVVAYKQQHGEGMLATVPKFHESVREDVKKASQEILDTSVPLYLQALTIFQLLHRFIEHITIFYSQRRPKELGKFTWTVDGKDAKVITRWERWWANYAVGALSTMSRRRPAGMMAEGADYSFLEASYGADEEEGGIDLARLLADVRFSPQGEPGLELVDIVTNAVRRALAGNLQKDGWQNIHKLMVHRNDPYIQFVLFGVDQDIVHNPTYGDLVREGFSYGGKSMLTPRNLRLVEDGSK